MTETKRKPGNRVGICLQSMDVKEYYFKVISRIGIFAFGAIVIVSCSPPDKKITPEAHKGTLDLRQWNLKTQGPIPLNGEWEFYWNSLFTSQEEKVATPSTPAEFTIVPGSWESTVTKEGTPRPVFGYATYRVQIKLKENSHNLSLIMGQMGTACNLSVNDEILWNGGIPGRNASTSQPRYYPSIIPLPNSQSSFDLILRCSNYHHSLKAGFWNPIELGDSKTMLEKWESLVRMDWFSMGSLLIMGLYHLGLYSLRRKDRSALWFGLFCLLISLRSLSVGTYYISRALPLEYFWIAAKLDFLSFYLATPVMVLFLANIFPKEVRGIPVRIIVIIGLLSSTFALVTPQAWYTFTLTAYEILIVCLGLYCIVCLVNAMRLGRQGSRLFFAGFLIFFASIVNDILVQQMVIIAEQISAFGLFVFILCQAFLLSRRFADAFVKVEELSSDLEIRNDKLRTLDKAKDEFLANTSHELRTPLHGMIGLAEALLENENLNPKVRRNIHMIAMSGKRLASLVNDILDFQKLRNKEIQLKWQTVELQSIVDLVIEISTPLVRGKKLELINNIEQILPIYADENRLQQVLQNLIGNAIKFTPEGRVSISAENQAGWIAISIKDTGIGIPKENQERIFESFEQSDASTEREFGGTGLGLSITKHLVELHGGSVSVDSSIGHGSTFVVRFPQGNESLLPTDNTTVRQPYIFDEQPSNLADYKSNTGLKILVVDDEPVNREILLETLGARNYSVKEAGDGATALELLKTETPDAILLDVMMPKMNGYEVCRIIRENLSPSELPIVFLSAKNRTEDLVAGFEAGGNDYLPKPFSSAELLARVKTQTNFKIAHHEAKNLKARLIQQEQLATIGNMAAGIVHDLKNPIGLIKGSAELADDSTIGRDERRQLLRIIEEEANRMILLVQDLLNYSQGAISIQRQRVDIKEYVARIKKTIETQFKDKRIQLSITNYDEKPALLDPDRFLRVIINIASNAAEAMNNQGNFDISISRRKDRLEFVLTDDGPGIPEQIRESVFQPFVTHGKSNGTGLGMAIAKSMVDAHDGVISFTTETGQGTTFKIEVPA